MDKKENLANEMLNAIAMKSTTLNADIAVPFAMVKGVMPKNLIEDTLCGVHEISKVLHNRPKSIVQELRIFRKHAPKLLDYCIICSDFIGKLNTQNERLTNFEFSRANKKWSEAEDNWLIELVCSDDNNIHLISSQLGRSPSAICSRLSHLVGIRKLEQSVAGKFIGTINGEEIEGHINGLVKKEE